LVYNPLNSRSFFIVVRAQMQLDIDRFQRLPPVQGGEALLWMEAVTL
jgi:hypothetical protein